MQLAATSTTAKTTGTTESVFDAFATPATNNNIVNNTVSTSIFDAFSIKDSNMNNNASGVTDHFSTIKSTSSIISGPTEFKDDPFKDYRYEDPFNIKDPFADDDDDFATDPDKVFKDDLSSDGELMNLNKILDHIKGFLKSIIYTLLKVVTLIIIILIRVLCYYFLDSKKNF